MGENNFDRGGHRPASGIPARGKWTSFADMSPDQLAEISARGRLGAAIKLDAKKMSELSGFIEAHRDQAQTLYGAKLSIILGLIEEATEVIDVDGVKTQVFNSKLLSDKRMNTLLKYVDQFEARAFGKPVTKVEATGNVDVIHRIAQLKGALTSGEDS